MVGNVKLRFWTEAVLTLALACVLPVENARILAIETIAAKSHWNFMSAVLRSLTDGGHNVTVFTPFPEGNRANYMEVDTSGILPVKIGMDLSKVKREFGDVRTLVSLAVNTMPIYCDMIYNDRRLTDILADDLDSNFDAIIIESGPAPCLTYAAADTDLPVIHAVPMARPFIADCGTSGDVSNPATVSSILARRAVPKTFAQRFSNTLLSVYIEAYVTLKHALRRVSTNYFGSERKPYDAYVPGPPSISFTNGHYISDAASPISANVVAVGGIHLKPPQTIPKDILEFIDDSSHGVILFTFGSTVLMSSMPDHIRAAFLEALAQLPQRVLLKYEDELEGKPNNVMIRKWFPQRDILVHPKVKLFVSHGGISGVYEAVDAGVPVLGFPLFSDQYRNIDNLVEAGMAISMEIMSVSKDMVYNNIVELVNNEKYKKNAEITSNIFKDRPLSPQQSVVYWTEYVIRHKGAPHLKSQAFNLTWYQYFLLDVIAVFLILISVVLFIIYKILKIVYRYTYNYSHFIKTKCE